MKIRLRAADRPQNVTKCEASAFPLRGFAGKRLFFDVRKILLPRKVFEAQYPDKLQQVNRLLHNRQKGQQYTAEIHKGGEIQHQQRENRVDLPEQQFRFEHQNRDVKKDKQGHHARKQDHSVVERRDDRQESAKRGRRADVSDDEGGAFDRNSRRKATEKDAERRAQAQHPAHGPGSGGILHAIERQGVEQVGDEIFLPVVARGRGVVGRAAGVLEGRDQQQEQSQGDEDESKVFFDHFVSKYVNPDAS